MYELLHFTSPVGVYGDCYDRYFLRIEELRQSLDIIVQCLRLVIPNSVGGSFVKLLGTSRLSTKQSMESLIQHFKLNSSGYKVMASESFTSAEAPKGEFGVYLSADGTCRPSRCKIRAPGFFHLQGTNFMVEKHMLPDIITTVGTQDIVFGEIDR